VKLLWYDRHGFWLAYKRLERGRFRSWPASVAAIGMTELTLLLEGIDLRVPRLRRVELQRVD
jgi:transposase